MCRGLQKQKLTLKKRHYAAAKRKQKESKIWELSNGVQVQRVDPENLVFIDEMGVLLGLTRTHARSAHGSRVYDFKPFYR